MEEQTCYIFKANLEPPAKRRKISTNTLDTTFELRKRAYTTLWARQEQQIHVRDLALVKPLPCSQIQGCHPRNEYAHT